MGRRRRQPRKEAPGWEGDFLYVLDAARFAREALGFAPDAQQADLLRRSPRRCLLNCARQWGKSMVTAVRAIHRAYFWPGSLTLVVSPSGRQSGEFLRKAGELVTALGIEPKGDGDNEISLAFPNRSRIVGLPGNEATIRGFSKVSLLLVDEAARVEDSLYRAVRPMLAATDGELWLMSTPYGKRGFFYETWVNGGAEWERVSVRASDCSRYRKEQLEEDRVALGDRWYRQEYCCEFMDTEDAVVRREVLDSIWSGDWTPLPRY